MVKVKLAPAVVAVLVLCSWKLLAVELILVQPVVPVPTVRVALESDIPVGAVHVAPIIGESEQKSITILCTAVGAVNPTK